MEKTPQENKGTTSSSGKVKVENIWEGDRLRPSSEWKNVLSALDVFGILRQRSLDHFLGYPACT